MKGRSGRTEQAARVERLRASVAAEYSRRGGGVSRELAGGTLVFAGAGHPMSRAVALGIGGPVTAADLDDVEAFYLGRKAAAVVELCPYAHPTLADQLSGRRYALQELENVWTRPIARGEVFAAPPGDIAVRRLREDEAELWSRGVAGGSPADLDVLLPFLRMRGVACFVAFAGGEPAGGGCLAVGGGVAELLAARTRPELRGRGVQTALLASRLAAAAAAGCDLACATTRPGSASERNVERLGFGLLGTRTVVRRG